MGVKWLLLLLQCYVILCNTIPVSPGGNNSCFSAFLWMARYLFVAREELLGLAHGGEADGLGQAELTCHLPEPS